MHEGQNYTFRIIELKDDGKNLVVSRRVLLEEAERERADEVRATIIPGAKLPGRVVSVKSYGAFIDLGGIDGLLHVTDMSWGRAQHPTEIFKVNEDVEVIVLKYEADTERVSLGYKQLHDNPWAAVPDRYPACSIGLP